MKTKRKYVVALAVICPLVLLAGIITGLVFLVRYINDSTLQRRIEAGQSRAEKYFAELSDYAPQTTGPNLNFTFNIFSYAGDGVFDTSPSDVFDELSYADSSMYIDLELSLAEQSPRMYLGMGSTGSGEYSIYLFNDKLYFCSYVKGIFDDELQIGQVTDGSALSAALKELQSSPEGWQDIRTDIDIDELLAMLGAEDDETLGTILSLAEDPTKLFADARREKIGGRCDYIFDLDVGYFKDYFDATEQELSQRYQATYSQRSACAYISPRDTSVRVTLALSKRVRFGVADTSIVTAFDFVIGFDGSEPHLYSDVALVDEYARGALLGEIDRSGEALSAAAGEPPAGAAYYSMEEDYVFSADYTAIGGGMFALVDGNRLDIFSVDGFRVRSLEYRYEIERVSCDGKYMTVLLGEPVDFVKSYLKEGDFVRGGDSYMCVTHDLADFSVVGEAVLPVEVGREIKVACRCGDGYALGVDGLLCLMDASGRCESITDFYTLHRAWYYDGAENKLWLSDYYLGTVVVDPSEATYTRTSADIPSKYASQTVEVEGYDHVRCFASWQGYELCEARANGRTYLALYDAQKGEVIVTVGLRYFDANDGFVTDDGRIVWWEGDFVGVYDLSALLAE